MQTGHPPLDVDHAAAASQALRERNSKRPARAESRSACFAEEEVMLVGVKVFAA